jgi:hypothetical protein
LFTETDSQARRLVYPLWLRFFTLAAAVAAFFLLVGPSSMFINSDPAMPWNEQKRIVPRGQTPHFNLSEERPKLTNVFRYKTEVEQEGQPKGEINFLIYPDGTIKGMWKGEYDKDDDTHCVIMAASYTGNIDPTRRYIENGTEDPSKLYFIAAGAYNILETTASTGKSRNAYGFVYLRGWFETDFTAAGELIITPDKKNCETFSWAAEPAN